MHDPTIRRYLESLELIASETTPGLSLESLMVFMMICERDEIPLTEIGDKMDWNYVKTYRVVNALAEQRYSNNQYHEGYHLIYTEEDPTNRALKNAYLTEKGKQLRDQITALFKASVPKKS
jgi:DNA-binding MarR family transcriptional regulator